MSAGGERMTDEQADYTEREWVLAMADELMGSLGLYRDLAETDGPDRERAKADLKRAFRRLMVADREVRWQGCGDRSGDWAPHETNRREAARTRAVQTTIEDFLKGGAK
jgi:hypothetical protein